MVQALVNNKVFNIQLDKEFSYINEHKLEANIINVGKDIFHLIKDNKSYLAEIISTDFDQKSAVIAINGKKVNIQIKNEFDILLKEMGISSSVNKKINNVKAPMPGLITQIFVKKGAEIQKGENLLALEAMKMENILKSPTAGIVKEVNCKQGQPIEKGTILIVFE